MGEQSYLFRVDGKSPLIGRIQESIKGKNFSGRFENNFYWTLREYDDVPHDSPSSIIYFPRIGAQDLGTSSSQEFVIGTKGGRTLTDLRANSEVILPRVIPFLRELSPEFSSDELICLGYLHWGSSGLRLEVDREMVRRLLRAGEKA